MLKSIIRTVVPLIVGYLVTLGLTQWTGLSSDQLTAAVTAAVSALYYVVARFLEEHVSPSLGVLLGVTGTPAYPSKEA